MLFEFHKWQNDKRPGSLHATYLIYGTKKPVDEEDGDVDMTSSQMSEESPPVRFSDDVLTETLSLVKQEELEGSQHLACCEIEPLSANSRRLQICWPSMTRYGLFTCTVLDLTP